MGVYVPPGFKLLRDFLSEAIDRKHAETSDTPERLRSLQEKLDRTSNAGWGFFDRMDINEDLPELRNRFERERKFIAKTMLDKARDMLVHGDLNAVSINKDGAPDIIIPQWWIKNIGYDALITGRCGMGDILVIVDCELANIYMKLFDEERASGSSSKVGDGTKAKACLVERMTQSPKKPQGITDKTLFADMKKQFPNLSKRAFDRAKAAAIEETGALDWKKGGRR